MLIYSINGMRLMKSKIKLNLDEYFKFLEEYFKLFKLEKPKRKLISGKNFKL